LLALALSILNFAHSTILVVLFDPTDAAFQFGQFLQLGGLDGFSLALIWLVTLLMPIVLLSLGRVKLLMAIIFWLFIG